MEISRATGMSIILTRIDWQKLHVILIFYKFGYNFILHLPSRCRQALTS